jgi:hypothetical protein
MFLLWGSKLKFYLDAYENIKKENESLRAENQYLREAVTSERDERQHLSSLILKKTGFELDEVSSVNKEWRPLGRGVANWARIKSTLENNAKIPKVTSSSLEEVDKLIEGKENANN